MSEVSTTAIVCFESDAASQRWFEALQPASQGAWNAASSALQGLGLKCVQGCEEGISITLLNRYGRRIELQFMELDLESKKLLDELTELGASHVYASTDDGRTGNVTKEVRIGKTKVKAVDFEAALAEFDDPFAFKMALRKGKAAEVKRLLSKGVDPNQELSPNLYPILLATFNNKKPIVKQLIAAGANLNVQSGDVKIKSNGRRTSLHIAVEHDAVDLVELLLKHGADTRIRNAAGQTPLYVAIKDQHQACCKLLIEHGGDPNTVDDSGRPALFNLGLHADQEIPAFLAFLESMGIDLDAKLKSGENLRWTLGGVKHAARFLAARGMAVSAPTDAYTGEQAHDLYTAILRNHLVKIDEIIAQGIDPNTPYAYSKFDTPQPLILLAVRSGDVDVVRMLLEAGGNASLADESNHTLLHEVAFEGNAELIKLLLDHGADPNAIEKNDSLSQKHDDPLLKALDSGNMAAAEILAAHWAPTPARLELAKVTLKYRIEHEKNGADAVSILKMVSDRKLA